MTALRLSAVAAMLASATACDRFGMPAPATREAGRALWLWQASFVAAAVVGGATALLILWAALRYRRRDDALPEQTAYHVTAEILYTAIPVAIIAVLFAATYAVQRDVVHPAPRGALVVDVTGYDWDWSFHYAGTDVTVVPATGDPVLTLPVGRPVTLRLTSPDVIHSFWVPRFLVKLDVIPGRTNELTVTLDATGRFVGRCAEFCGVDHAHMTFAVDALPGDAFDHWLANGGHA